MSAANDSPAPGSPASADTGIQTAPAPATAPAPIPLPPAAPAPRVRLTLEAARRHLVRYDGVLVALTLALAALMALFPVRNSDFWLHLAVGRGLVNGEFGPTAEPFSYNSSGTWVNHSWLYGLLLYGGYKVLGGAGLVAVKGAVVALLAILLLRFRRKELGLWIPVLTTVAALLAMLPRLHFQPALFSYLFLSLTLLLVGRREPAPEADAPESRKRPRSQPAVAWLPQGADRLLWLLVPLFVLWVNVDAWFLIGPAVVALVVAGEILQETFAARSRTGAWRPLATVLLVGIAACVLNPSHVRAFSLPPEVAGGPVVEALRGDALFGPLFASSWDSNSIRRLASTVSGLGYLGLVLVGALSFLVNLRALRWDRLLVFAALLALAGYRARAIPFFVVAAAPIVALNLQDFVLRVQGAGAALKLGPFDFVSPVVAWLGADPYLTRAWGGFGRLLTTVGLFALLAHAWPGWLLGYGYQQEAAYRVRLAAEPDASLVRAAEQLRQWRADGVLTGKGFNIQPEVANILAWLSPAEAREQGFFDFRLGLYSPAVAKEYVDLRKALNRRPGLAGLETTDVLGPLKARGISHVLHYDARANFYDEPLVLRAANDPGRWIPLHLDGRTAVYAVLDGPALASEPPPLVEYLRQRPEFARLPAPPPRRPADGPWAGRAYDPATPVYGPSATPLPPGRPADPNERPWWHPYVHGSGLPTADADEARMLLTYFDGSRYDWHYANIVEPWGASLAASLAGYGSTAALTHAPYPFLTTLALKTLSGGEAPAFYQLEGACAPLLLAVRRARAAVRANPYDPLPYAILGKAYQYLRFNTPEARWSALLPQLAQLRDVQAVAAYQNALRLNSGDANLEWLAHDGLKDIFRRLNYYDLTVKHLEAYLRISEERGPLPKEDPDEFEKRIDAMRKEHKALDKELKNIQNEYAVKAHLKKSALEKASLAMQYGLAEQALAELLKSDSVDFGSDGVRMQLDLLMVTGDITRLRYFVELPENREALKKMLRERFGAPLYDLYRFQAMAAIGDYAEADKHLTEAKAEFVGEADKPQARATVFFPLTLSVAARPDVKGPRDVPEAKDLDYRQLLAAGVAQTVVRGMPQWGPVLWMLMQKQHRDQVLGQLPAFLMPYRQQADMDTLRGILALESGDVVAAKKHFEEALGPGREGLDFGGRAAALGHLEMIEKHQKKN